MKPMAIWSPSDHDSLFTDIWTHNQLRTRPRALEPWPGAARVGLGERVPILRFHCGLIQLEWVGWTRGRFGFGPAAVHARGKSIGRRCLILASAMELEGYEGCTEIRPIDEEYILIGAVWRPQVETGLDPDTVSVLCTSAPLEWATHLADAPVIVPVHRCADWLDAGRDAIPLQEAPNTTGLQLIGPRKDIDTAA